MKVSRNVLLLIIIGFIVYFNSFFNGFVWDDEEQIVNNAAVYSIVNIPQFFVGSTFNTGGSGGMGGLYYKPLMPVFFSALYSVFGPSPLAFHFFQVMIHILNSILVYLLFKRLLRPKNPSNLPALFLSIIFLVHPINTEAAIYSSAMQDVLFFFFGMLALLFTLKNNLQKIKNLAILTILLTLSLLSKETGAVFIPIVFLLIFTYKKKELIPYTISAFISIGIYSLLRFAVAGIFFNKHGLSPITTMSLAERLWSVPKIIYFYLKTTVFPWDLAISQHWVVREVTVSNFYLPLGIVLFFLLLLAGVIFFLWKKQSSALFVFLFFLIWFVLSLGLHLQIFPLDMTVADRWFYLPLVGVLGMAGVVINEFRITSYQLRIFLLIGAILLIGGFSVRTMVRNTDWRNGLILYSHDIKIAPGNFDLENNYGVELYRTGKFEEAETHFKKSTELAPNWWTNWNNLGAMLERKKDYKLAKEYYLKAINNGNYYMAYENYAYILFLKEDSPNEAKEFSEESLKKLPYNTKLWLVLALSEYKLGNKEAALKASLQAYTINPSQQTAQLYQQILQDLPLEIE